MGCLLIIFAVIIPRITMVLIFLFTNWFSVFQSIIWPILGFLFMPYTTLAYMLAMIYNHHQIAGGWLVLLIVAIFVDISGHSGSYRRVRH